MKLREHTHHQLKKTLPLKQIKNKHKINPWGPYISKFKMKLHQEIKIFQIK